MPMLLLFILGITLGLALSPWWFILAGIATLTVTIAYVID